MNLDRIISWVRRRSSISKRLGGLLIFPWVVYLCVLAALSFVIYEQQYEQRLAAIDVLMQTAVGDSVAEGTLLGPNAATVMATKIIERSEVRSIVILDAKGKALFEKVDSNCSQEECPQFSIEISRPRVVVGGEDIDLGGNLEKAGDEKIGMVRYTVDHHAIAEPIYHYCLLQFLGLMLIGALVGFPYYIGWNSVRRPFAALMGNIGRVSRGQLVIDDCNANFEDEIGILHGALKSAVVTIRDQQADLVQKNEVLLERQDVLEKRNREIDAARQAAVKATADKEGMIRWHTHLVRNQMQSVIMNIERVQAYRDEMAISIARGEMDLDPFRVGLRSIDDSLIAAMYVIDRVNVINEDLYSLAQLEAVNQSSSFVKVNLLEKLSGMVREYETMANTKGLAFLFNCRESDFGRYRLHLDWDRLATIIDELLANAIKFTDDGSVLLECELVEIADNTVSLKFSVSDTGDGFSLGQVREYFDDGGKLKDRGFDFTNSTVSIGLRRIEFVAKRLGASISLVYTKKRQGSRIEVDLNALAAKTASFDARKRALAIIQRPLSVLYVEDTMTCQWAFRRLCEESKIKINLTMAGNGRDGFELFKSQHWDVVVTDLYMPVMDGDALIRSVRAYENETHITKPVRIIVLTADASGKSRAELIQVGANDYLTKPFKRDVFVELIESTVEDLNF